MKIVTIILAAISILTACWWVSTWDRGKNPNEQALKVPPAAASDAKGVGGSGEQSKPVVAAALVSGFNQLKGSAAFSNLSPDGHNISATDPEYQLNGLKVIEKGEGISRPMFSLKGGRGELVFGMNQGKPVTGRSIGELFVENGHLVFKRRIGISFHRAARFAFILDGVAGPNVQKIGLAVSGEPTDLETLDENGSPLPKPRPTFRCFVSLEQEGETIKSSEIDQMEPVSFSPKWFAFDVTGSPVDFQGRSIRVLWFALDSKTGKLKRV